MIETIIEVPLSGKKQMSLVHVVLNRTERTSNDGTEYLTQCREVLYAGIRRNVPQYNMPTCLRCLGVP